MRYDIYIKGKLWRSVYDPDLIAEITMPYDEGDYFIKEISYD